VANVTFEPLRPELYDPAHCPAFIGIEGEDGYYGCPAVLGQGVKVGGGETAIVPDRPRPAVTAADVDRARRFVERFLPAAAGPVQSTLTCLYTETPDGHFIIDRHPAHAQVVLASPCSGHGFKHASAIGPILADLAVDGSTTHDIGFLRLDRDFAVPPGDVSAAAWRRAVAGKAAVTDAAGENGA
jgi:sarcosine oxidase